MSWVALVAVVLLGVTAGAMLAEAALLVPYWQSLTPNEFFDWYAENASRLVDFYSPLEIGSALISLLIAIACSIQSRPGSRLWWTAAVLSIVVIAMFFVYFKDANAGFSNRTVAEDALAAALTSWGRWQWARVFIGISAFAAAVLAIRAKT